MKYVLVVDLKIDGKVIRVPLSVGTLSGLLRYTAYCYNTDELIRFLPHDKDFSVRDYVETHLNKKTDESYNPFSIRKKENINSRKIDVLYKKDLDILLVKKEDLINLINNNYSLNINDISSGNIPLKIDMFLKEIYSKFKNYNLVNTKNLLIERKLDPDKIYDSRYEILRSKPYLSLALDDNCVRAFAKIIMKDEKKKLEFLKMLKKDLNRNLLTLNSDELDKRYKMLCERSQLNGCSSNQIRNNIRRNIKTISEMEKSTSLNIKPYTITDDEILEYNKLRKNNSRRDELDIELVERINDFKQDLNRLYEKKKEEESKLNNLSFLETEEDIKNKLKIIDDEIYDVKIKLISLEYDYYSLQQNDSTYSDSSFIVDKSI